MMKKLLTLTLALLVVLSLCACGGPAASVSGGETSVPTTEPSAEPTTEPSTAATTEATEVPTEDEEDPRLGSYADGVYINDYLGVRCALDENWTVFSAQELASLNGMVAELMTDEDLAEQLASSNSVQLFYAMADEGLVTLNIGIENLGILYGTLLDEQSYADRSVDLLVSALESAGMENVTAGTTTVTFAGGEHVCVTVHGTFYDVDVYEQIVCVKMGSYMALYTAASYYEDITTDLLDLFTAI